MKICILAPRFPWPEYGGDVLRISRIARYFKSRGHQVILVSFVDNDDYDVEAVKFIYDSVYVIKRNRFVSMLNSIKSVLLRQPMQCGFYYSLRMSRLIKEVISKEQPDLYVSHLLRMSRYIEENGLLHQSILEMTDALSKTYELSSQSAIGGLKEIIYRLEKNPIKKSELNAIRVYPKVVLVSQQDIDFLRSLAPDWAGSLALHTNGVECVDNLPVSYDNHKICFVGNMRTLQNQDAVRRFLTHIFPIVKQKIPEARFYIVGSYPPESIKKLADGKNVFVTGYVDDLHSMLKDSCIAVAPVEIAAGIQNKVLVAMGSGVPVVMSSLISKAIPQLSHHENCMICHDNDAFADSCLNLMTDPALREKIALAGYNMVRSNYSWEEKLRGYELLPNK